MLCPMNLLLFQRRSYKTILLDTRIKPALIKTDAILKLALSIDTTIQ